MRKRTLLPSGVRPEELAAALQVVLKTSDPNLVALGGVGQADPVAKNRAPQVVADLSPTWELSEISPTILQSISKAHSGSPPEQSHRLKRARTDQLGESRPSDREKSADQLVG